MESTPTPVAAARGPVRKRLDEWQIWLRRKLRRVWEYRFRPARLDWHNSRGWRGWLKILPTLLAWPFALVVLAFAAITGVVRLLAEGGNWWWERLKDEPIKAVLLLAVMIALFSLVRAAFLRVYDPETTVIISSFELSSTPPKELPITGKTAADVLKDEIQKILDQSRYITAISNSKVETSARKTTSEKLPIARSVALGNGPEISGVGIEVEGISFEKVRALYESIRQDQKRVEGDVVFVRTPAESAEKMPPASLSAAVPAIAGSAATGNGGSASSAKSSPASSPDSAGARPLPAPGAISNSNATGDDGVCKIGLRARIPGIGNWITGFYPCTPQGLQNVAAEMAEQMLETYSPPTIARYRLNQGRTQEGLLVLRKLAATEPTDPQSHFELADALYHVGDLAGAIAEYRQALGMSPDRPDVVHTSLAQALYDNYQTEAAEAEFREAIRLNPAAAAPHEGLSRVLLDSDDAAGAERECLHAVQLQPDDPDAQESCGEVFDREGRVNESLDYFREAVRLEPSRANFHLNLGIELDRNGDYDAAITEYRQYVSMSPNDWWGHEDLGYALQENGEFAEAIREQQDAIRIAGANSPSSDMYDAYTDLGWTYYIAGDYDLAIEQFNKAALLRPKKASAWGNLATAWNAKGNVEMSLLPPPRYPLTSWQTPGLPWPAFDNVWSYHQPVSWLVLNGWTTPATAQVGTAGPPPAPVAAQPLPWPSAAAAYLENARRNFLRSVDVGQTQAEVTQAAIRYADLLSSQRFFYDANYYYKYALEDGSDSSAFLGLGNIADEQGREEEALLAFRLAQKAAKSDRERAAAYLGIGEVMEGVGRRGAAISQYRKAVQLDADNADAQRALADALEELYQYSEVNRLRHDAWATYDIALRRNPADSSAHESMGAILSDMGMYKEAVDQWNMAAMHQPENAWVHNGRGSAMEAWHRPSSNGVPDGWSGQNQAIWEYRIALMISNDFKLARTNLAYALNFEGDHQQAIAQYLYLLRLYPRDVWVHNALGITYTDAGNYDKAIEEQELAITLSKNFPSQRGESWDFPDGHRDECEALTHKGDYSRAIQECEVSLRWSPRDALTHLFLGDALRGKRDHCSFCWKWWLTRRANNEYSQAILYSNAALKNRQDAESFYILARADLALNNPQDAETQLYGAFWFKPIFPKALYLMGQVLQAQQRDTDADYYYAKAQELDPMLVSPIKLPEFAPWMPAPPPTPANAPYIPTR